MSFILSDSSLNSYGFRILTSGAKLDVFKNNPVMYAFHGHHGRYMPIGKWTNIRVEDDKLLADPEFDEADDFALDVKGKVERGYMKAASVGFEIIAFSEDPKLMLRGQKRPTVTEWEPFEASIVPVGSNRKALKLRNNAGLFLSGDMPDTLVDQILPQIDPNPKDMDITKMAKTLGLKEGASEQEVLDKINELQAAKTESQPPAGGRQAPSGDGDSEKLVEPILKLGRAKGLITDANADHFRKLAQKDADAVLSLIESQAPAAGSGEGSGEAESKQGGEVKTLAQALQQLSAGQKAPDEPSTWAEYQEKAPQKLELMRKEKPDEFKKLYREHYGVTPEL